MRYTNLKVSTPSCKVHYDFDLKYNEVFVSSDSGTGKTFLCNMIKQIQLDGRVNDITIPLDDVVVMDVYSGMLDLSRYKDKLIIIDNWDYFCALDSKFSTRVYFNIDNQFIIFGRNPDKLYMDIHQTAELVRNGDTMSLEYWKNIGLTI